MVRGNFGTVRALSTCATRIKFLTVFRIHESSANQSRFAGSNGLYSSLICILTWSWRMLLDTVVCSNCKLSKVFRKFLNLIFSITFSLMLLQQPTSIFPLNNDLLVLFDIIFTYFQLLTKGSFTITSMVRKHRCTMPANSRLAIRVIELHVSGILS